VPARNIYNYLTDIFPDVSNRVVFEIGAHVGNDTKKLFNFFGDPDMYCFECDPRNIDQIKNIDIYDRIKFFPIAISDSNGFADFYLSSGTPEHHNRCNTASSSLLRPYNHLKRWDWVKFDDVVKVETKSLDTFCADNNIDKIDFIWADTQGSEYNIIIGGKKTLSKTSYLYTEYSDNQLYKNQKTLNDLIAALPGKWSLIKDFKSDVLLRNDDYESSII
jgi:FkbM family methyltransferase